MRLPDLLPELKAGRQCRRGTWPPGLWLELVYARDSLSYPDPEFYLGERVNGWLRTWSWMMYPAIPDLFAEDWELLS